MGSLTLVQMLTRVLVVLKAALMLYFPRILCMSSLNPQTYGKVAVARGSSSFLSSSLPFSRT